MRSEMTRCGPIFLLDSPSAISGANPSCAVPSTLIPRRSRLPVHVTPTSFSARFAQ